MKINLNELAYKDKIEVNENIDFSKDYYENSDIKELKDVFVKGFFCQNNYDEYNAKLSVNGTMYLEDSITLKSIPYDFSFEINGNLEEFCSSYENILDLQEFLWQNIVLEVPISYSVENVPNMKGENWQVTDEKEESIDPRMQKIYDVINKGGED